MKHFRNAILVAGSVLIIVIVSIYIITIPGRRGRERILSANHPALLAACRELITTRQSYSNEQQVSWADGIYINGNSPQFRRAPQIIQDLRPLHIRVNPHCVLIYVALPPRAVVFGYAEGAEQFGTTKLIDGLWLGE